MENLHSIPNLVWEHVIRIAEFYLVQKLKSKTGATYWPGFGLNEIARAIQTTSKINT